MTDRAIQQMLGKSQYMEEMERIMNQNSILGQMIGPGAAQAYPGSATMPSVKPKDSTEVRIRVIDVANGKLVVLTGPYDNNGAENNWERTWVVPEGQSVTDTIAAAMAVKALTR